MKFTEGGFKNWGYDVAESEFGDRTFTMRAYEAIKKESGSGAADEALGSAVAAGRLVVKDVIADAFLQNTLLVPQEYSVIATLNLNGDYISDQLAAMVGGIGIAPGANINFRTGHAIFEATHGTAPNIAGRNVVNPSSILLSAVMMLEYMGMDRGCRHDNRRDGTGVRERTRDKRPGLVSWREGNAARHGRVRPGSDRQFITFCKKSQSFVYCAVAKLK